MTADLENWSSLGKIDPELEERLAKHKGPPFDLGSDIVSQRSMLAMITNEAAKRHDMTGIQDKPSSVKARDGYEIPIRILSQEAPSSQGAPLIFWIHGGGFCVGNMNADIVHALNFVRHLGAIVVLVDYRLAPEHPFPIPGNDCFDVLKWIAKNAREIGSDPSKGFVVGGPSAGGNLASVLGVLARDEQLSPPLTGLCLLIPGVCGQASAVPDKYKSIITSYEQNKDALLLNAQSLDTFMKAYKPDDNSTLFNNFAPGATLRDLPPVFLQVCGMDPLRDEALLYERILRQEHEIPTKLEVYPGLPHSFWEAFPDMKSSQKFRLDTVAGVEWLLAQKAEAQRTM